MYIHIAEGSTAMKRTTILADEGLLLEAQQLAARRGVTFTTLVQEALREYLKAHRPERQLSIIGIGSSGEPYPVDREGGWDEALLSKAIDPIEGWSPRRSAPESDAEEA
jgi:hypothetical protein